MLIAAAAVADTQGRGAVTLESVLQQLDAQGRSFHSLTADVERTKVTAVVNDKSTETGRILVRGDKMRIDLKTPDARTILRHGDKLEIYNPKLNRVEEYDLGKNRSLLDQFLLLGFGTSSRSLEKAYGLKLLGEPTLDGKKVTLLELTPKSDEVRNQISKIDIWLDESSWLPVQQKFFETGSDDYFEIHYTNAARNPGIDDNEFKPKWPHGTEKVHPQGQ
jgi:outer membrane lipoprotein-sorting protein